MLIPFLYSLALCSSQANEGSSREATSRIGREETPSRVWPAHHPRESSKEERFYLQQVMIYRLFCHWSHRYGNNNYTKHISGYPYSSTHFKQCVITIRSIDSADYKVRIMIHVGFQ